MSEERWLISLALLGAYFVYCFLAGLISGIRGHQPISYSGRAQQTEDPRVNLTQGADARYTCAATADRKVLIGVRQDGSAQDWAC